MMADLLLHVRRTPDRLLHPLRRRKAVNALRRRPRPAMLLVLCHGNICRSPVAAAILGRELAAFGIRVQSAGFIGFNRPAPPEATAAARRHDVELSDHRSRLVTADLVRAADLILVMDPDQRRLACERFGCRLADVMLLGDFDSAPVEARTIRDPVNQSRAVFDEVYERIARCARDFVTVLTSSGG